MPDNQIRVEYVADASQLKTASAEAATAVERMGSTASAASPRFEQLEGRLGHMTAHVTAHAIPGMAMFSRSIASVGEAAIGAGPFLAAMLPVAAIAGGVMLFEHFAEAARKAREEETNVAVETNKLSESLLKAQEAYVGLTRGGLAKAELELSNFSRLAGEGDSILSKASKGVEEATHWWNSLATAIANAARYSEEFNEAGSSAAEQQFMTGGDVQERIEGIRAALAASPNQLEGTRKALGDMNVLLNENLSQQTLGWEDRNKKIQRFSQQLATDLLRMEQEQKNKAAEVDKEREADAKKHSEAMLSIQQAQAKAREAVLRSSDEITVSNLSISVKNLEALDKERVEAARARPVSLVQIQEVRDAELQAAQDTYDGKRRLNELTQANDSAETSARIASLKAEGAAKIASLVKSDQDYADQKRKIEAETAASIKEEEAKLEASLAKLRNDDLNNFALKHQEQESIAINTARSIADEEERLSTEAFQKFTEGLRQVEAEEQRSLAIQLEQNKLRGSIIPGEREEREAKIYERQALAQRDLVEVLREKLALTQADRVLRAEVEGEESPGVKLDDRQITTLSSQLSEAEDRWQQYTDKVAELHETLTRTIQDGAAKATQAFNREFTHWVEYGGSSMKMLTAAEEQMTSAVLGFAEKRVEAFIAGELKKIIAKQSASATGRVIEAKDHAISVLHYAKEAAAGAFKSAMHLPFPVNLIVAPIAAAGAFAGTMAFAEQGGISQGGATILHKNEMVLPPHISAWIQQAAKSQSGGNTQREGDHFHYSPTVNAIDRGGVEDALREHSDTLFSMWQSQMRNRNLL